MTVPALSIDRCPEARHFLVFSIQEVSLGVDTSQIEEMLELSEAKARGLRIRPIHEECSFGDRTVTYKAPKVITLKDHRGSLAALIDRPDRIAEVTVDSIQGVPALIAARPGGAQAIWGAILSHGEIILLLDLLKLPQAKPSAPGSLEHEKVHQRTEEL